MNVECICFVLETATNLLNTNGSTAMILDPGKYIAFPNNAANAAQPLRDYGLYKADDDWKAKDSFRIANVILGFNASQQLTIA